MEHLVFTQNWTFPITGSVYPHVPERGQKTHETRLRNFESIVLIIKFYFTKNGISCCCIPAYYVGFVSIFRIPLEKKWITALADRTKSSARSAEKCGSQQFYVPRIREPPVLKVSFPFLDIDSEICCHVNSLNLGLTLTKLHVYMIIFPTMLFSLTENLFMWSGQHMLLK